MATEVSIVPEFPENVGECPGCGGEKESLTALCCSKCWATVLPHMKAKVVETQRGRVPKWQTLRGVLMEITWWLQSMRSFRTEENEQQQSQIHHIG